MNALAAIIIRDATIALRGGAGAAQGLLFFLITTLIFALAIGPDLALLSRLAAPVIWAAALLATLVSLERVFHADHEDGSLDLIAETADPLALAFLAKAAAHWLTASAPLLIIAPAAGLLLNLPPGALAALMASLLVGTPALSLIGAMGAALTVSVRRANLLIAVLVAPLYAPVLIFGAAAAGGDGAALLLLAAVSLLALIVAPVAGAAALRYTLD